ncbi:Uu.00g132600.m01.CDS01 [Anthostomella pinea]|uniref:Uu.00g132600.m01.CDS01 n=1 Tax=Anthostomella pinea TaxID=933095 RepID=A0AAI8YIE2_9PEZI|nr:Uu.00g132600.m01.CDS01 [Anthostomella pinea]
MFFIRGLLVLTGSMLMTITAADNCYGMAYENKEPGVCEGQELAWVMQSGEGQSPCVLLNQPAQCGMVSRWESTGGHCTLSYYQGGCDTIPVGYQICSDSNGPFQTNFTHFQVECVDPDSNH